MCAGTEMLQVWGAPGRRGSSGPLASAQPFPAPAASQELAGRLCCRTLAVLILAVPGDAHAATPGKRFQQLNTPHCWEIASFFKIAFH